MRAIFKQKYIELFILPDPRPLQGERVRHRRLRGSPHDGADPLAQALRTGDVGGGAAQRSQGMVHGIGFHFILQVLYCTCVYCTSTVLVVLRSFSIFPLRYNRTALQYLTYSTS